MVELSKNEQFWEDALLKAQEKLIKEKLADVKNAVGGEFTVDELRRKVEDFNSTVGWVAKDDFDLYDKYRFRMFHKDCEVVLLQDPIVVSEMDKLFEVQNELYNLIDYDEVDVDAKRYGEGK
jgi:hypothetical protein